MKKFFKNKITSVLALIIFVAFSAFSVFTYYHIQNLDQKFLENKVNTLSSTLNFFIQLQVNSVNTARVYFDSSENVERDEFDTFVKGLLDKNPNLFINGMAYVERVLFEDKLDFIEEVRNDTSVLENGYPNFDIFPNQDNSEYYVINYLYPFTGAFGYDQRSEPKRRMSLENTRDNNEVSISEVIELIGEDKVTKAILLFSPVYKKNLPLNTIEQRRTALDGFISAALHIEDYIDFIINDSEVSFLWDGVDVEIYDLEGDFNSDFLIYSDFNENIDSNSVEVVHVNLGDRKWEISVMREPGEGYGNYKYIVSIFLFILGLLISLFIYNQGKNLFEKEEEVRDFMADRERHIKEINNIKENLNEKKFNNLKKEVEKLNKEIEEKNEEINKLSELMIDREAEIKKMKSKNV